MRREWRLLKLEHHLLVEGGCRYRSACIRDGHVEGTGHDLASLRQAVVDLFEMGWTSGAALASVLVDASTNLSVGVRLR